MWRDEKSINAVEAYLRLALGAAFAILLYYLVFADRIDIDFALKILSGMGATFHIGKGLAQLIGNRPS